MSRPLKVAFFTALVPTDPVLRFRAPILIAA